MQEKDKVGTSFYIKLNGIPVFMKGANYIPPHSFLPSARENVYKALIKNTVEGNMNMLRVWGGGVYAEDVFMMNVIKTESWYGRTLCLPVLCTPEILSS